jgi:CBS domain-containing protein
MEIQNLIRRSAVTLPATASLAEAARLMKENDVGSVVITDGARVVGIVTDRDIVVRLVAEGRNPATAAAEEAMTRAPVCLAAGSDVEECLNRMEAHGVRRIPLLDARGKLVGVVSLDDVLLYLGVQMGSAAALIRKEVVAVPVHSTAP